MDWNVEKHVGFCKGSSFNPTNFYFYFLKLAKHKKHQRMRKKNPPQVCGLVWCCKFWLAQGKRGRNTKLTKETLATPMCISTNNARRTKTTWKKQKQAK